MKQINSIRNIQGNKTKKSKNLKKKIKIRNRIQQINTCNLKTLIKKIKKKMNNKLINFKTQLANN